MKPDSSPEERRASLRLPVDLFVNRFLNGLPYLCRATDISRTGMRLQPLIAPMTETPSFMGLQFQLPDSDEVITASGETVFVEGQDGEGPVGVRFTRLGAASAEVIDRFVSSAAASSS